MYLEHFGFAEPPFRITPHTEFFFSGANRGATLDALIYAIIHDEGIVKVSGEVGSGKTMLCRMLMERLPTHVVVVYLANPSLSREDILLAIAGELGLSLAETARVGAVMRALQDRLIALYGENRQVVVLIDEAHAMPAETLEEIRLLSNLESNRHKLLQLVLFGQQELNAILSRPDMRQLKERITHNFGLEPLVQEDVAKYLGFRLRVAGYRGAEIFSPGAVRLIAAASLGLTRRINILADKALLAAYTASVHLVTPKLAQAAIEDSEFSVPCGKDSRAIYWTAGGASLAAVAILGAASVLTGWRADTPPASSESGPALVPPAVAPSPTPAPLSAVPVSEPAVLAPSPASAELPPVAEPLPAAKLPGRPGDDKLPPLTRQLVQETRLWAERTDKERWFVQLVAVNADRADFIEKLIERFAGKQLEAALLRAYTAKRGSEPRVGAIYGEFASQRQAEQAIAALPAELKALEPYPRQVKRLR